MRSYSSREKCHEAPIVLATPFVIETAGYERDRGVLWKHASGHHGNIREIKSWIRFPRMPFTHHGHEAR
jgi:hypothetical protein